MLIFSIVALVIILVLFYWLYHFMEIVQASSFFIDLFAMACYVLLEKEGRVEVPICKGSYEGFYTLIKQYNIVNGEDKIIIQKKEV